MNQQRARRFRASQLAQIEHDAADRVAQELSAIGQGHQLPKKKEHFDSNCITPGTPFMAHLATCLRYHIAAKQNSDPLWKNVSIYLYYKKKKMDIHTFALVKSHSFGCYCSWRR